MPEGIGFALAGWLQIGLAAAVLTRPSRLVIRIACISSIAFIAVWVVSRVWGLPVGPESGSRTKRRSSTSPACCSRPSR